MIHVAKFVARHLFLSAFLALVAGAVLLTLARVLTPVVLARYTDDIAAFATERLGQPVTIGRLDAHWQGLGPALVQSDVSLMSHVGRRPVLTLDEVGVDFGLADMLKTGFIAPGRITVKGTRLTLVRRPDGSLHIQGVEAEGRESGDGDASALLLIPARVELRESQVEWLDQMRNRPPLVVENVNLGIRNDEQRHQVDADFRIGDRPFILHADLFSTAGRLTDWRGEVYFRAERVSLPRLLGTQLPTYYGLDQGQADLELWGNWNDGRLQTLSGHGSIAGLQLTADRQRRILSFDELGGRFLWRRTPDGWRLDIGDLVTRREGRRWPTNHVAIDVRNPGATTETYHLSADYLNLADLMDTLELRPPPGALVAEFIAANPTGEVRDLDLEINPRGGRTFSVNADLQGFSMAAEDRLPLFHNLSAHVHATANGGRIELHTRDALIYPTKLFRWPLPVERLSGEIRWQRLEDGWRMDSDNLALDNEHIRTLTRLRLDLPQDGSPVIDMQTDFRDGIGSDIPLYLPAHIMPPKTLSWLDRSILDGRVPWGSCIVRGPLNDFPFHKTHTGHFEVTFGVEDGYLDYKEGWPPLENLVADLRFHNNRLDITHGEADLFDSRLSEVTVAIDNLWPASPLTISGHTATSLEDMIRFLRESPLRERFRHLVDGTVTEGDGTLTLDIKIPLRDVDDFALQGRLEMADAALRNPAIALDLTSIAGALTFTERDVRARKLTGRYAGTPITASVRQKNGGTWIDAAGSLHTDTLKRRFPILQDVPLDGKSPWSVAIGLPEVSKLSSQPVHIEASSTLDGTRVDLPLGLGKPADAEQTFTVDFDLGRGALGHLNLVYGELDITASPTPEGWDTDISGPTIEGRVFIPAPARRQPLRAELERIAVDIDQDLLGGLDHDDTTPLEPSDIPAAVMKADQVLVNGHDYGALQARTVHIENGVRLEELVLESATGRLALSADWTALDSDQQVDLALRIDTEDVGTTLRDLQLAETIQEGEGKIDAKIRWSGGPLEMRRETLAGSVRLRVDDGRLEETEPGVGRLFGLLNLTALQRRLRLDFSDLFKEGMTFDKIEGTFALEAGVARTSDTRLEGPAGDIAIEGSTNLATTHLDQEVAVTPAISGAVAIAGTLAVNPALGVALLAAGKNLDRLATTHYHMAGPWDDPQIERIATQEEQDAPPPSGLPEIH